MQKNNLSINLLTINQQPKMLDYAKLILNGVSFDAQLFEHELKKALATLQDEKSKEELSLWCYERFASKFGYILQAYFPIAQRNC